MTFLKSWFQGLRGKLMFAAIFPIVGFLMIGYFALSGTSKLTQMLSASYENEQPTIIALGDLLHARASIGYFAWAAYGAHDKPELHADYIKKANNNIEAFEESVKRYESTPMLAKETEIWSKGKETVPVFLSHSKALIEALNKNTPESRAEAFALIAGGDWHKNSISMRKNAEAVLDYYKEMAVKNIAIERELAAKVKNLLFTVGAMSILITLSLLTWIAYRTSTSVSATVTRINDSGSQVNLAIQQLTQAGMNLSQSSASAAASLEETVASLEEMTSMVQMNSDNAKQAATLSMASIETATKGELEIKVLVNSMQEISDSSKKIAEIIHVIDDIAFQTNLLALNASVEAARAGEHGKGFAVVADAVRTLAQRSATAAKDISVLIKDSVEKIDNGTHAASKGGSVMTEIVTAVKKVSDLANEIAAASSEQTTGIQQISRAMNQLDQSSQSNAASSEEIASTAEEISSQAVLMQNQVESLSGQITGGASHSGSGSLKSEPTLVSKKSAAVESISKKSEPNKGGSRSGHAVFDKPKSSTSKATVSSQPTPIAKSNDSKTVIPFDEDDGRGNIGDASGF